MKISVTYLYTIMTYGYPPKPQDDFKALEAIQKMGFHYLEMEGLGREHGENILKNLSAYQAALRNAEIHVHNFCVVDPDLTSLDAQKQAAAFDNFRRLAEVGVALGAETLHLASYAPPVHYAGRPPYQLDGDYEFGSQFALSIPDGFDWQRVWDNLVRSTRFCCEAAKEHGKIVLMEPRVGEIICSPDSLIRLIDDVGMNNLKANFDTGHFSAQRENINLALMKLAGKFANIHIADNDPVNPNHITVGTGTIDWKEFFRLLKKMDYSGYLGLDLGGRAQLVNDLLASRDYISKMAAETGCEVSW